MQTHELKRKTPNRKKIRVGRGGKRGKTSGRGHKGQKARAGHKIRPEIRDMIKKIPKKRGYKFNSFKEKPQGVNLSSIEKAFNFGSTVSPKTLLSKGLVKRVSGNLPRVKILATGKITKKLIFEKVLFSRAAEALIEAASSDSRERAGKKAS
ncbi:50S ribosomal protein L15 [Candidatus Campbellbacteria bacterium CG11_big_fil_rev_8_21_14_0_20_44_21]|uniref:Large ribosomal subunit protein uL15 n=1 Tax=Candidatus Campbellbacteria bacterium CG22_combo_CG10-13_8_21_14_all_43_18 TaxID=1974530 RepID=A0A2H0DWH7_9BACT|nr:MAG: 50S ribosomal protein L15 [Candidatus Campbellbacteria bacterium CG22_combo_CG10-13_8_21_14_all_43_18]PIR24348.1 MAG: 50S ribosomal protein L15 [Candidatus Campbellbacteria bacterium CG11_big_fil_rev_8_21_14_0_20_44_21]